MDRLKDISRIIGVIPMISAVSATAAEKAAAAQPESGSDWLGTAIALAVLAAAIGGMVWNFRRKVRQGGCACCSGCAAADKKQCGR